MDLARWGHALTEGRLISQGGYEALHTPDRESYAYGWRVGTREGMMEVSHGGGLQGYSSLIVRVPDVDLCVVVLSNVQPVDVRTIADRLAEIALGAR